MNRHESSEPARLPMYRSLPIHFSHVHSQAKIHETKFVTWKLSRLTAHSRRPIWLNLSATMSCLRLTHIHSCENKQFLNTCAGFCAKSRNSIQLMCDTRTRYGVFVMVYNLARNGVTMIRVMMMFACVIFLSRRKNTRLQLPRRWLIISRDYFLEDDVVFFCPFSELVLHLIEVSPDSWTEHRTSLGLNIIRAVDGTCKRKLQKETLIRVTRMLRSHKVDALAVKEPKQKYVRS